MISRRHIQRFVNDLVDRFRPESVILFGSYAYGRPTADSDVDLMVIMPHAGDAFLHEVTTKGVVLYENRGARMGR